MKKSLYVFFFTTVCAANMNAQITITQNDVATVGKVILRTHDTEKDTMPGSINPGPAGANQTWNFSTLITGNVDTLLFTNPAWLPNGSNFPNANLAIINSSDSSETYLENNSTGLYIDGVYGDLSGQGMMALTFNPTDVIDKFSDTYNSTFQNTAVLKKDIPLSILPGLDSGRIKHIVYRDSRTDGYGNVTTPLGTFPSLRHREMVIVTDTIWIHNIAPPGWFIYTSTIDTVWHFSWWANNIGFSLLEFDSTKADTIKNITWLKTMPTNNAVNELSNSDELIVYPNPSADGEITVYGLQSPADIEIYNSLGKKVYHSELETVNPKLNISDLANGFYFLKIGNTAKKIILQR